DNTSQFTGALDGSVDATADAVGQFQNSTDAVLGGVTDAGDGLGLGGVTDVTADALGAVTTDGGVGGDLAGEATSWQDVDAESAFDGPASAVGDVAGGLTGGLTDTLGGGLGGGLGDVADVQPDVDQDVDLNVLDPGQGN
ncbi:MAG: hypothetical protein WBF79_02325, partial [Rhodococcus sp. (in: high G+C Gram-positive bacteria)]